jgi:hypothetical protein
MRKEQERAEVPSRAVWYWYLVLVAVGVRNCVWQLMLRVKGVLTFG